jgi:hypothetical protein
MCDFIYDPTTKAKIEAEIEKQNLISEILPTAEKSTSNWSKNIQHLNKGT